MPPQNNIRPDSSYTGGLSITSPTTHSKTDRIIDFIDATPISQIRLDTDVTIALDHIVGVAQLSGEGDTLAAWSVSTHGLDGMKGQKSMSDTTHDKWLKRYRRILDLTHGLTQETPLYPRHGHDFAMRSLLSRRRRRPVHHGGKADCRPHEHTSSISIGTATRKPCALVSSNLVDMFSLASEGVVMSELSPIVSQFRQARRVSVPLVAINTPDSTATMRALMWSLLDAKKVAAETTKNALDLLDFPLLKWDAGHGLVAINEKGLADHANLTNGGTKQNTSINPAEALRMLENLSQDGIVFFYSAHRFINNDFVAQGIANLRDRYKMNGRMLVLPAVGSPCPPISRTTSLCSMNRCRHPHSSNPLSKISMHTQSYPLPMMKHWGRPWKPSKDSRPSRPNKSWPSP